MTKEEIEEMIFDIDNLGEDLTDWEIDFIADLIDNPPKEYSDGHIRKIKQIYNQRCR